MLNKNKYILFSIIFSLIIIIPSCSLLKGTSDPEETEGQKEFREQEQMADEQARKEYEDALKKHFESQSEGTTQMMRGFSKRQPKVNRNLNRKWHDQLFNSSCFRNSCFVKNGHMQLQIINSKKFNKSPFVKY